ncbi:unnamed protein product [Nezara viridula]|uniref:Uncharacterized protein n=1 Tax=Nezara viridula TaxID=85310 RepID=A0A9P0E8J3_NEZVI|nr:unnamed protein product [Nezara viridula]
MHGPDIAMMKSCVGNFLFNKGVDGVSQRGPPLVPGHVHSLFLCFIIIDGMFSPNTGTAFDASAKPHNLSA